MFLYIPPALLSRFGETFSCVNFIAESEIPRRRYPNSAMVTQRETNVLTVLNKIRTHRFDDEITKYDNRVGREKPTRFTQAHVCVLCLFRR